MARGPDPRWDCIPLRSPFGHRTRTVSWEGHPKLFPLASLSSFGSETPPPRGINSWLAGIPHVSWRGRRHRWSLSVRMTFRGRLGYWKDRFPVSRRTIFVTERCVFVHSFGHLESFELQVFFLLFL